ncbi:MAG: DUF4140 domain-containing protein, partial [Bacteroidota bacterium]
MKKLILFVLCICFIVIAKAIDDPKPVKSTITDVTVFLSGAQVTRSGSVQLGTGVSYVVFENLPQYINSQS